MENLPAAAWWFLPLLLLAIVGASFAWGSWHRGRYTEKHERVELRFADWLKNLPDDLDEAEAQLNARLDELTREANRKRDQLRELFYKARG